MQPWIVLAGEAVVLAEEAATAPTVRRLAASSVPAVLVVLFTVSPLSMRLRPIDV